MLDGFIHELDGKTETQAGARVRARQPSRKNNHGLLLMLFFSCERKKKTEITLGCNFSRIKCLAVDLSADETTCM